MIVTEHMELPGKCTNLVCQHSERDGEEVTCIQMDPWSTHPKDHLCKNCKYWQATEDKKAKKEGSTC